MAYTERNFPTKKALVDAFLTGRAIAAFQPGPFGPDLRDGETCLEGPHYPQPHRWYCEARVVGGYITALKIKGKWVTGADVDARRAAAQG